MEGTTSQPWPGGGGSKSSPPGAAPEPTASPRAAAEIARRCVSEKKELRIAFPEGAERVILVSNLTYSWKTLKITGFWRSSNWGTGKSQKKEHVLSQASSSAQADATRSGRLHQSRAQSGTLRRCRCHGIRPGCPSSGGTVVLPNQRQL